MANSSFYGNNPTPTEYRDIDELIATAEAAAEIAQTAGSGAATSASNAAASAAAAAGSAAASSTSASQSASYSVTATTAKDDAQAAATSAASSASNAITAAANAATNAAAASGSATAASTSASAAASSASDASASKLAAATSATNASNSQTYAANSATTAASQATAAGTSATNAANSASLAAVSATNAAAYELSANEWATKTSGPVAGSEYSAKYHAQAAATTAASVSTTASTATTQAGIATTKASEAATSASNAATSATTATTKASEASTSASTASSAATTATTKASEAAASATSASTSASTATTKASEASTSASNAATSASNAATSASAAAGSASAAASSATSAASAQLAAESARDQALAAFDNFDDRYLGPKASDPSTDNDGNPLVGGTLYFNTTTGVMMLYTGSAWVAAYISGVGVLTAPNNLSDLANIATARTNLGLGSAALQPSTAFATATHTHAIADVTGLQTALDGKAASGHTHTASQISDSTEAGRTLLTAADAAAQRTALGLGTAALSASTAFATAGHTHAIADVSGLQAALDGKQASLGYTPLNKAGDTATGNVYFSGGAEALTNAGNYGFRIRAKAAGNGILQFTDNGATAEWGSLYSTGSGNLQTGVRFYTNAGLTNYNRMYSHEWIEMPNHSGLYSPLNAAHFYPSNASYGPWRVNGTRNGWGGLEFENCSTTLMMNTDSYGFHWNGVGWRFYVTGGSGHFPGNVVAYWSDGRLKENLRPIGSEALEIIGKLTTYRFNWNQRVAEFGLPIEPGKEEIGLIAQHVQAVLPDAVNINKSASKLRDDGTSEERDYLTINYDRITPILVQAINELRAEVEELKAKLNEQSGTCRCGGSC